MKNWVVFGIMLAVLAATVSFCGVPACAAGEPVVSGAFGALSGGAWGDDEVYDLVAPVYALPAANAAQEPLFVIGPVDPDHPQSLFALPHDRVIPIPAGNRGKFSAIWRALLVVPTAEGAASGLVASRQSGLAYAVDFGAGFVNLTSVEKVAAAEMLGLVETVDVDFVFVCAVVPPGVVP
jgi:hypothetical protein